MALETSNQLDWFMIIVRPFYWIDIWLKDEIYLTRFLKIHDRESCKWFRVADHNFVISAIIFEFLIIICNHAAFMTDLKETSLVYLSNKRAARSYQFFENIQDNKSFSSLYLWISSFRPLLFARNMIVLVITIPLCH